MGIGMQTGMCTRIGIGVGVMMAGIGTRMNQIIGMVGMTIMVGIVMRLVGGGMRMVMNGMGVVTTHGIRMS
jgi:hypothetical protein